MRMSKTALEHFGRLIAGGITGYSFFWLTSHKRSPLHRKIPKSIVKNVSFLPHIKYIKHDKHYHFHHWVNLGVAYIVLLALKRGKMESTFVHGLFLGAIFQGLSYSDRFRFIYNSVE